MKNFLSILAAGGAVLLAALSAYGGAANTYPQTNAASNVQFLGIVTNADGSFTTVRVPSGSVGGGVTNALVGTTNTILVCSSGLNFTNLWQASTNASANYDTIYVAPGIYYEGNHVCAFPKNITVTPLATATFYVSLSNTVSALNETNIYIRPVDNMVIQRGMTFICQTTNKFSAIFGASVITPSATNWQVSLDYLNADSDGVYWGNTTNKMIGAPKGGIIDSALFGYWDEFATLNTAYTNLSVRVVNTLFSSDNTNQPSPAQKRPVNIASAGVFEFDNCTFVSTVSFGSPTDYGFVLNSQSAFAILNNCVFRARSYDILNGGTTTNLILNAGCAEINGNTVSFDPSGSPFGGSPVTANAVTYPVYDSTGGAAPLANGTWAVSTTTDDAGTLLLVQSGNVFQGANTTNAVTSDGTYWATGFGIYPSAAGLTATKTIYTRNSANSAAITNTIVIKGGIITSWTP